VGTYLLSVVQVWLLRRLGVSVGDLSTLYPERYRGLGWYAVGYAGQSTMEEAIFRAGLVGAVPVAVGVSPRVAVVVAAVGFGLAHADRGPAGVVVTGTTGLVYGVGFLTAGLPGVAAGHTLQNVLDAAGKRLRNGRQIGASGGE
jgi:CAAX amino terminal protease family.